MLDLKRIREDPEGIERRLKTRDPKITLQPLLELDERRRALIRRSLNGRSATS